MDAFYIVIFQKQWAEWNEEKNTPCVCVCVCECGYRYRKTNSTQQICIASISKSCTRIHLQNGTKNYVTKTDGRNEEGTAERTQKKYNINLQFQLRSVRKNYAWNNYNKALEQRSQQTDNANSMHAKQKKER